MPEKLLIAVLSLACLCVSVLCVLFGFRIASLLRTTADSGAADAVQTDEIAAQVLAPVPSADSRSILWIGDSRTVGIGNVFRTQGCGSGKAETMLSDDTVYFAAVGAGVFSITGETVSVDGYGAVTLSDILRTGDFDTVCIMLGVNDVGYRASATAERYLALLNEVCEAQPEATVYLLENLYVTAAFSDADNGVCNADIAQINRMLASYADGERIFSLDPNPLFAAEDGSLRAEVSSDGLHLTDDASVAFGVWLAELIS